MTEIIDAEPKGVKVEERIARSIRKKSDAPATWQMIKAEARDLRFETEADAVKWARERGVIACDGYRPIDLYRVISILIGGSVRENLAHCDLEWRHPILTKEGWVPIEESRGVNDGDRLARFVNEMTCAVSEVSKPKKGEGRFRLCRFQSGGRRTSSDRKAMAAELRSLAGEDSNLIPRVHPFSAFFEGVVTAADEMTPEEQAEAVEISKTFLLRLPHFAPTDPELGKAASECISGGLILRLAEAGFGFTPRMQKLIPTLIGDRDVGKTTLLRALSPEAMIGFTIENFTPADTNEMHRQLIGRWLAIWDEIDGGMPIPLAQFNGWLTSVRPSIDMKYRARADYPRTAWVIGAGNAFSPRGPKGMAVDNAILEAFVGRFLICPVEVPAESSHLPAEDRVRENLDRIEEMRSQILIGAYLRWLEATDPNDRSKLSPRALGIEVNSDLDHRRNETLRNEAGATGGTLRSFDEVMRLIEDSDMWEFTSEFFCDSLGYLEGVDRSDADAVKGAISSYFRKHPSARTELERLGWRYKTKPYRRWVHLLSEAEKQGQNEPVSDGAGSGSGGSPLPIARVREKEADNAVSPTRAIYGDDPPEARNRSLGDSEGDFDWDPGDLGEEL